MERVEQEAVFEAPEVEREVAEEVAAAPYAPEEAPEVAPEVEPVLEKRTKFAGGPTLEEHRFRNSKATAPLRSRLRI